MFTNDFPALLENVPAPPASDDPLFQAREARGTCRVMCFHPKSNKTLPIMTPKEIRTVIDEYELQLGRVFNFQLFYNFLFQMDSSIQGVDGKVHMGSNIRKQGCRDGLFKSSSALSNLVLFVHANRTGNQRQTPTRILRKARYCIIGRLRSQRVAEERAHRYRKSGLVGSRTVLGSLAIRNDANIEKQSETDL